MYRIYQTVIDPNGDKDTHEYRTDEFTSARLLFDTLKRVSHRVQIDEYTWRPGKGRMEWCGWLDTTEGD